MAVINPAGFLQNAGATHTAEQMRNWNGLLLAGKTGATSLVARGGTRLGLGNELVVTQTGSPSMAVIVGSGLAVISGTEGAKQGTYSVLNDANVTLGITAAHATLNRIDLVCFQVQDQQYSGSVNSSSLVVITGTPASSPVAPTAPNNSITLAQIFVGAAVSSIVNANITDKRAFIAAAGGIIPCFSASRPVVNTVPYNQIIYELDTNLYQVTYDSGASWFPLNFTAWQTWAPTLANLTLGNGSMSARFCQIGKTIHFRFVFVLGTTSSVGNDPQFTIPTTSLPTGLVGNAFANQNGGLIYPGYVQIRNSTTVAILRVDTSGANASTAAISSTSPFTFANLDSLTAWGTYESV